MIHKDRMIVQARLTEIVSNKKRLIIKWIKCVCIFIGLPRILKIFGIKQFDIMRNSIMFIFCSYCDIGSILYLRISDSKHKVSPSLI